MGDKREIRYDEGNFIQRCWHPIPKPGIPVFPVLRDLIRCDVSSHMPPWICSRCLTGSNLDDQIELLASDTLPFGASTRALILLML